MTPTTGRLKFRDTYPNGVEAAVRAKTPGVAAAEAAVRRLTKLPGPRIDRPEGMPNSYGVSSTEVANLLVHAAKQGDVEPGAPLELARQVLIDNQALEIADAALRYARDKARADLSQLVTPVKILNEYPAAFELLLADLAALEPLGDLLDPESAHDADRMGDYKAAQALFAAYAGMRRQHFNLLRDGAGAGLAYAEVAVLVDVAKVFKDWAPWRSHGVLMNRAEPYSTAKRIKTPWPHAIKDGDHTSDTRGTFETDAAAPQFLIWARTNGVDLWMPTRHEYERRLDAVKVLHHSPTRYSAVSDAEWIDPSTQQAEQIRRQHS